MFSRVRWSLLRWNLLIITAVLLLAGLVTYISQARSLLGLVDQALEQQAIPAPLAGPLGSPKGDLPWFERQTPFHLIVDDSGRVLADPDGLGIQRFALPAGPELRLFGFPGLRLGGSVSVAAIQSKEQAANGSPGFVVMKGDSTIDGQPVRLLLQSGRLMTPPAALGAQRGAIVWSPADPSASRMKAIIVGGQGSYAQLAASGQSQVDLVTGVSLVPMEEQLHQTLIVLLLGGAVGLLLALGGAWFLSGRALVPIQRAFRRQQEFVADAAHELRTPLTVLQTSTHLLAQHRHEPLDNQGRVFDDLHEEIGRLTRLTCDLLDLARSDMSQLELAVGNVDLEQLGAKMVDRLRPVAAGLNLDLRLDAPGPGPVVEADPDRLQQVLMVLLDNALKHTPAGGDVTLSISERGGTAAIEVRDNGQGIPPDALRHVFDRFYRLDPARSRRTGGAGLGLAIAKTLVEAHGGILTIASTVGAGTTAVVHLPLVSKSAARLSARRSRLQFLRAVRWL